MQQNDDPLGLFRPTPDDPDLDKLLRFLEGRGWLSAAQIRDALGERFTDRRVRSLAAASYGQILSFPGSPGYCITREATADDRDRAINTLKHQADDMTRRALAISRVHRGPSVYQ